MFAVVKRFIERDRDLYRLSPNVDARTPKDRERGRTLEQKARFLRENSPFVAKHYKESAG